MPTIARSELGRRIDHRVAFLKDYPDAQQKIERRWRPVAEGLDELTAEKIRIQESFELTVPGKQAAFGRLDEKALVVASRIEGIAKDVLGERAALLASEEAAARGEPRPDPAFDTPAQRAILAALKPKAPAAGQAPEVTARRHEEIRELVRRLEPREVRDRYLGALRDGSDREFIEAVEGAPASFPVLDAMTMASGREFKIQRSPRAVIVDEARTIYDVNVFLVEAGWGELYTMFPLVQLRDRRPNLPQPERPAMLPFGLVGQVVKGRAS